MPTAIAATPSAANLSSLDRRTARRIIEQIGSAGQPPSYGVEFFSAGIEDYLSAIHEEYLSDYIQDGGASFKMVVGVYGGGKTHFLYSVRDLAWQQNFAVSYVSLKSSGECPFHKLELVYKAIINGLVPPLPPEELSDGYEPGISAFLQAWYSKKLSEYQGQNLTEQEIRQSILAECKDLETSSDSFSNAIRKALEAYSRDDLDTFRSICQWLKGEGFDRRHHAKQGILQRIDKSTAFHMIRSLGQTVRHLGYSGLVVLLDEAERVPSLSSRDREQHLSNLREVIDECSQSTFQGMMLFYAVPDANFLEGKTMVYEALKQRVSTTFTTLNPMGVMIELENSIPDPIPFLEKVGGKLQFVYETAYPDSLDADSCRQLISEFAEWAYEQRFQDEGYKRLFVQKLITGFGYLHRQGQMLSPEMI